MTITSFNISSDKQSLELVLADAATADSLSLWTYKTYRTEGLEIDLTSKLNGTTSQTISITLEDLSLSEFDGVYFIEVSSPTEKVCSMTEELTRYKECIIEKLLQYEGCDSCLENNNPELFNVQAALQTLIIAIEQSLPQEVITILYMLDKFCSNDCKGCNQYK